MEELWKTIPDTFDSYQVSNLGRVKRLPRRVFVSRGKGYWSQLREQFCKTRVNGSRNVVELSVQNPETFDSVILNFNVDKLVAQAFCTGIDLDRIYHVDGNYLNDAADNLSSTSKFAAQCSESEEWRDIRGLEGIYQVSEAGNVRSLERYVLNRGNYIFIPSRILKPYTDKTGYQTVYLRKADETITYLVHRLVADAFIDNPDNLPVVNHKDFNPSNNHSNNLEWCNTSYNVRYSATRGRYSGIEKPGVGRYNKLTKSKPVKCLNNGQIYPSMTAAEDALGLRNGYVSEQLKHTRAFMDYTFELVEV